MEPRPGLRQHDPASGIYDFPVHVRYHHTSAYRGGICRANEIRSISSFSPFCGPHSFTIHFVTGSGLWGGWMGKLGALDFAGGTVVHISSGISALAAALIIGKTARLRVNRIYSAQPAHDAHRSGASLVRLVRVQCRQRPWPVTAWRPVPSWSPISHPP